MDALLLTCLKLSFLPAQAGKVYDVPRDSRSEGRSSIRLRKPSSGAPVQFDKSDTKVRERCCVSAGRERQHGRMLALDEEAYGQHKLSGESDRSRAPAKHMR